MLGARRLLAQLNAASLAACTALTLKMYTDRKGWDIDGFEVEVDTTYDGHLPVGYHIALRLPIHLDEEQQKRLRVISGKCPVHRTLATAIAVELA